MNASGGDARRLTHTGMSLAPAAWDASGDRLLADSDNGLAGRLYAVSLPGGQTVALTAPTPNLVPEGLSANGRTVLAALFCHSPGEHGLIETIPFAGGAPKVLLRGPCDAQWTA
jgi:hypothetical protein